MTFRDIIYYYSARCMQKKCRVRGGYDHPFCQLECENLKTYSDGEYFCMAGRMVRI